MSKSYPYLELARKSHSDYGDVLSYADVLDHVAPATFWQRRAVHGLSAQVKEDILKIWLTLNPL